MSFNAFYGLIGISVLVINDNYTKKNFFIEYQIPSIVLNNQN